MNNPNKLQKLSAFMVLCCVVLIVSLPISVVWFWLNLADNLSSLSFARPGSLLDMQYIQSHQVLFAGALNMLTTLLLLYGLWHLRSLFKLFQQGVVFTSDAAHHLYKFSLVLLISAIVGPATHAAQSYILSMGNPQGEKFLALEIGSNEISVFFIAATFLIITWILQEGQKLARENAEFV